MVFQICLFITSIRFVSKGKIEYMTVMEGHKHVNRYNMEGL